MTKQTVCYVSFTGPKGKDYAYFCGGLSPKVGDYLVVPVGADYSLKIVVCTALAPDDPKANKQIFGIIQVQPETLESKL
jgi:hypothetical protein